MTEQPDFSSLDSAPHMETIMVPQDREGQMLIEHHLGHLSRYTPTKLLCLYPQLLDRETVVLHDHYIISIDSPGFTTAMNTDPHNAHLLFSKTRTAIAHLLNREELQSITPLTNAGDEILSMAPDAQTTLLQVIAFNLLAQDAFMAQLEKPSFSKIRQAIESQKNLSPPYIHAGITHGSLTLKLLDLGVNPVTREPNRVDLLVMDNKSLSAKHLADQSFTVMSQKTLETGELQLVELNGPNHELETLDTQEDDTDSNPIITIDSSPNTVLETLQSTELTVVQKHFDKLLSIELDPNSTFDAVRNLLQDSAALLLDQTRKISRHSPPGHQQVELNLTRLKNTAKFFAHPSVRQEDTAQPYQPKEALQKNHGETLFISIDGLNTIRGLAQNHFPTDHKASNLVMAEIAAFVTNKITDTLCNEAGLDVEHTEFDDQDTPKLIIHNNTLSLNQHLPGPLSQNRQIVLSIISAIKSTTHQSISDEINTHLNSKNLKFTCPKGLNLNITAGLASVEYDPQSLNWVIAEQVGKTGYSWGSPPTGTLTSAAARFWSYIAHQHFKSQPDSPRLDLEKLAGSNCLVMQLSAAKDLNLADSQSIILKNTHLRGFPEPFDLIAIPIT